MKKINQTYIVGLYREPEGLTRHTVVQVYGLRLVSSVHTFSPTPAGELMRRRFIGQVENPHYWAKVPGLRIYLRLEGSLRRILPDEEQASQEEIHATLQEMALHYAAHALTDGQRRQYADRDVTPAEYLHRDLQSPNDSEE